MLIGTNTVYAQTAQSIAKTAFGSTVLLVMEDEYGQTLSLGSGFYVRDGEVASNLHVVEGASRGYAKIIGQNAKYEIEGISAVDPERDLVILRISGFSSPALTLGDSESVEVGETIYAVGNPKGLEGTFSQGIISSIRKVESNKLLQITAPISPGSSGGPILRENGEVVGISVATFRGGQNLNFAIPSNYLKTLLGKVGIPKPLAQAKLGKSQNSIMNDLGGRSSEGVSASHFTWENEDGIFLPRFTFSLRNQLREAVKDVQALVVFYASDGAPIDAQVVHYEGMIPPGLAKRHSAHISDKSVKRLASTYEVRILNFSLSE